MLTAVCPLQPDPSWQLYLIGLFVGMAKGLDAEPGDKGQIETLALIGFPP